MFLLDTNVHSELRRPDKANRSVVRWAVQHAPTSLYLSTVTIIEIEMGVLRLERHDRTQALVFRHWVNKTLLDFADRILPVDTVAALSCASLHVPNPRPDRDAYIAATALVHDLTVVTRNARDFEGTGVKLINPWEA